MKKRLEKTEGQLSDISKQINADQAVQTKTIDTLKKQLTDSSKEVKDLNEEIGELKTFNQDLVKKSASEREQIMASTDQARAEIAKLKKENEKQKAANESLSKKVSEIGAIESEKADAMQTIANLQRNFETIQAAKDKQIKDQERQLADMQIAQADMQKKFDALETQTSRLKASNQVATGR